MITQQLISRCKSSLLCAALSLTSLAASAADFYVVVPVKGRTAAPVSAKIAVTLSSYAAPQAITGQAYAFDLKPMLSVTGDNAYTGSGVSWTVVSSALPAGLYLTAQGVIAGTPTAAGSGSVTARATYKKASGEQTYQVVAIDISVALTASALPAGEVNLPYSYDFKQLLNVSADAAYSSDKVSWSVASGTLPPGLTLNGTGVLSGTPTTLNTTGNNFQILATYKTKLGQQAYTIVVNGEVLRVTQLAGMNTHTCAVTTAGAVKCWGENAYGQLGDGTLTNRTKPVAVVGLDSGVTAVSVGYYFSCALVNGGVKCWGYNSHGELGNGASLTTKATTPVSVSGLTSGVVGIGSGYYHTCAVNTSGGLLCWGYNSMGALGDGTTTTRTTPVAVSGLSAGVSDVDGGVYHTCARMSDTTVRCWGYNYYGQLGIGDTTDRTTPQTVSGLSGIRRLAVGGYHSCVLADTGVVRCWGANNAGQVGDGTLTNRSAPVVTSGLSGVSELTAGLGHTCVATSADVKCWGDNSAGQVGDGTTTVRKTPVTVPGLTGATAIMGANFYTCAMTAGGAKCWGANAGGQLGDGTTTPRLTPVLVSP